LRRLSSSSIGAMLLLTCRFCIASEGCSMAAKIAVSSIQLRAGSPIPDGQRVGAAFSRLAVLADKCTFATSRKIDDCSAIQRSVSQMLDIPADGVAAFASVTGCKVKPASTKSPEKRFVPSLIAATLAEQQASDGEASYWIADDLFALLIVYPDEFLAIIDEHPAYQAKFLSDLGGISLDDVGEAAPLTHTEVRLREKMLCAVLKRMPPRSSIHAGVDALIVRMSRTAGCSR
jgi:hypothetical protein